MAPTEEKAASATENSEASANDAAPIAQTTTTAEDDAAGVLDALKDASHPATEAPVAQNAANDSA